MSNRVGVLPAAAEDLCSGAGEPGLPDIETATPGLIAGLKNTPGAFKAMALAALNIKGGVVVLHLPDGRRLAFGEGPLRAQILIKDFAGAERIVKAGDIGFGEGYIAGEWDTPDLPALLTFFAANAEEFGRMWRGNPLVRAMQAVRHWTRRNSKAGSRRNILAHYDLGNAFYEQWLDPSMTYSSARFVEPGLSLEQAQQAKYQAIADKLELQPGERVLEIGCGWGGFAEYAAKVRGARVVGLTLSDEQLAFARARIARAGLSEQVELRLQDYRDTTGPFDKVASIEMFEAVGEKYWPAYFGKIADVLKPGGRAALQIITIRDELFEEYRANTDFIQKHVFPGGMLPSVKRLRIETARAGLGFAEMEAFGKDYARTLSMWRQTFLARWEAIAPLGFDVRFKRLWDYYLAYCEAGFATERTDVVQVALTKP
jgi:cyclopropane-fatty-acyl-phospholipid synthase